jgi:hypothetical protein
VTRCGDPVTRLKWRRSLARASGRVIGSVVSALLRMSEPPEARPPGVLIHDPEALVGVIKRLHATNDGVTFWNHERSFKLMLRNDPSPEAEDSVACELVMVVDEDDERMATLMELDGDGYLEEPGTYILDTWTFKLAHLDAAAVAKVQAAINRVYLTTVCPCGDYLIKDDATYCVYCHMVGTPEDKTHHFCSICCDSGIRMHMTVMPCCQQCLHETCLRTWRHKSGDERCPFCRQV